MTLAIVAPVLRWKHTILDEVWLSQNLLKIVLFSGTDVSLPETSQQSASKSGASVQRTQFTSSICTTTNYFIWMIDDVTISGTQMRQPVWWLWRIHETSAETRSFIVWIEYFRSLTNQFPLTLLDEMTNNGPIPTQNNDQPALPRWIDRKLNTQTIDQLMMHRFRHGMTINHTTNSMDQLKKERTNKWSIDRIRSEQTSKRTNKWSIDRKRNERMIKNDLTGTATD